jgi:hypothetical protein
MGDKVGNVLKKVTDKLPFGDTLVNPVTDFFNPLEKFKRVKDALVPEPPDEPEPVEAPDPDALLAEDAQQARAQRTEAQRRRARQRQQGFQGLTLLTGGGVPSRPSVVGPGTLISGR